MYIYLFPFGFQYTFTTLPQLGHFSDTMIQPEHVSPISQARFLHRLSGHFIFRIIPPPLPKYIYCYPPALIWNKGTSLSADSLLSFVHYLFSSCGVYVSELPVRYILIIRNLYVRASHLVSYFVARECIHPIHPPIIIEHQDVIP